jgi:hypothetical protein
MPFHGRGSGQDVLLAVVLLVAGTPLAALAGAVAFSCLAVCLEAPAAAVGRRLRGGGPVRVPPRSALAKTDSLGRSTRREGGETTIRRRSARRRGAPEDGVGPRDA